MADIRLGSMVIEAAGAGPAVVMIHGLGGSSNSFQTLMASLHDYRVLRPDLPGAGRSALRPGRPGLKGLVSAVRDGLKAAGVDRGHFVGHSMGTLICQHLSAETPSVVASLTLFGPILEPPPQTRQALADRAAEAQTIGMAAIAETVSAGSLAPAADPVASAFVRESLMRQDPAGYAAHCLALSTAEAADHAAIRCPTLLVAGAADPVAPVAMARRLLALIADSHLEIIAGAGHWMMLEAPQRAAALLRAHLDRAAAKIKEK